MPKPYHDTSDEEKSNRFIQARAVCSVVGFASLVFFGMCTHVAPPSKIFAITGWWIGASEIALKRRALVLPVIQQIRPIDLRVHQLDFSVDGTSKDMLGVRASFSLTVKPNDDDQEALVRYAKYICSNESEAFERFMKEQSMGAVRAVIANRTALEVFLARNELKHDVANEFNKWLNDIGMKNVAMSITNIADSKSEKSDKEKGLKGYFEILEAAKIAEANAAATQRQSIADTTAAQAVSEKDIAISEYRRKADEVKAVNTAAVEQKKQEANKAVELAKQATATEAERVRFVPEATAVGEAAITRANAEKQVVVMQAEAQELAAKKAAESYGHLLTSGQGSDAALIFWLHLTRRYQDYLKLCGEGMKDMKPALHLIQTGSANDSDAGKSLASVYNAALPLVMQGAKVIGFGNNGLFNTAAKPDDLGFSKAQFEPESKMPKK